MAHPGASPADRGWARTPWTLGAGTFVLAVGGALALARRGLDRTDEGMYLNAISHPTDDPATLLLFGYLYHPVYAVLGGDIAGLRWFGMLFTVALGALTAWTVLGRRQLTGDGLLEAPPQRLILSLLTGATGLLVVVGMPLTPSYNSLALQGLLISTAGLALALLTDGRRALVGWGVLGVGGALTFLGKPTTALALVVLLLCVAVVTFGPWLKGMPVSVLTSAAVLAVFTGGDVPAAASQVAAGLEASALMGGHDNLIRWDTPFHKNSFLLPALAVVGCVGLGLAMLERGSQQLVRVLGWLGLALGLGAAGSSVLWWVRNGSAQGVMSDAAPLVLLVLVLPALAVSGRSPRVDPAEAARVRRVRAAFLLFLVALPAAFAFGTNVNLWSAQGRAAIFWVLAATILLARRTSLLALAPSLVAGMLLTTYLVGTALSPYRYPSLLQATTSEHVTPSGSQLLLTSEDARRTRELLALGARLNIGEDTWILDLTGDSPGYVHELGARAAGRAWNLGGYPGSARATAFALAQEPCVLREAWLFVSPAGRRSIDPAVLAPFGLSVADYELVGSFERLGSGWGGAPSYIDTAQILKPRRTLEIRGCPP